MIQAIIVEDEDLSVKRLTRLLSSLDHDIKIIKRLESVVQTVKFLSINQDQVDLIFLDIHLADGHSFEVFNQIKVNIPIIFTTAYDQYALKAFQQTSVDYLMKPVEAIELKRSLEKFSRLFYKTNKLLAIDYSALAATLQAKNTILKKRFLVQVGSKIRSIAIEDIHLFYAENKACFLMTNEGKRYDINYTLEKLMNQLDHEQFFRLNRKIIASIQSVQEVTQYSRSRYKVSLKQSLGFEVFVSSERMSIFKRWLNR